MLIQDDRLEALRKAYKRALLTNLGTILTAATMVIILLTSDACATSPARLALTAVLSAALAVIEYTVERALFKRGKRRPLHRRAVHRLLPKRRG